MNNFKQLIPGNPGTSFVVCLLYVLHKKYGHIIKKEDQLSLFTTGITKSEQTFFSGVINEIAHYFSCNIVILSDTKHILNLARTEIDSRCIRLEHNALNEKSFDKYLEKYSYIVFSVDMILYRNYHDYYYVCISKKRSLYEVFEPKSAIIELVSKKKVKELISSIPIRLEDSLICFAVE